MILVTGSSGTVGTEVLKQLTAKGAKVRAAYRSRPVSMNGVEGRGGFRDGRGAPTRPWPGAKPSSSSPAASPTRRGRDPPVAERLKRAGVRRVVKLFGVGGPRGGDSPKIHRPSSERSNASGMAYTLLRPTASCRTSSTTTATPSAPNGAFDTRATTPP